MAALEKTNGAQGLQEQSSDFETRWELAEPGRGSTQRAGGQAMTAPGCRVQVPSGTGLSSRLTERESDPRCCVRETRHGGESLSVRMLLTANNRKI